MLLRSFGFKIAAVPVVFACIALTRVPPDTNAAVNDRSLFVRAHVPKPVERSLRAACVNCHSNETAWPWYSYLPLTSYLIEHDVAAARAHMNLSDWQGIENRGRDETAAAYSGICENLLSGTMPKRAYLLAHPEARLSKSEVNAVCEWSQAQSVAALSASNRTPK